MLWHAYSLPQITMETLSAEAGLDAMVLAYGGAYIQGRDAETVYLKYLLMRSQNNLRQDWTDDNDDFD